MNESGFWNTLKQGMGRSWDACRHEDACTLGVPDVSYGCRAPMCINGDGVNGWIELKHVPEWPRRKNTTIKIKHFTTFQKMWLKNRGKQAGHCFLFVRIHDDFLLFSWNRLYVLYPN